MYAAVAERQARGRAGRCAPGIGCRVSSGASAGWQGTQGVRRGRRCWQPAPAAANAPATACCSGRRQACLRGGRTAEQRSGWQLRCVAALGRMHRTSCAKLTLMMALRAGDAGPVLPPPARRLHHAGGRAVVARRQRRRRRRRQPGAGSRGRAAPGRVRALRRLQPCRGAPAVLGACGPLMRAPELLFRPSAAPNALRRWHVCPVSVLWCATGSLSQAHAPVQRRPAAVRHRQPVGQSCPNLSCAYCLRLQVQHVFTVLGTSGGGSRRAALADLRRDYERHHKHGGKV